jgi:hypothetical protein
LIACARARWQVLCVTSLERGTKNFDTAVEYSVANVEHHRFLGPQPTRVKEMVRDTLDLLELKSQLSKRAALAATVARLEALGIVHGRWEEEESLYGKMQLLLLLAERPLEHTAASDAQVAAHRDRRMVEDGGEAERARVAALLRAAAAEFDGAAPAPSEADSLSDWGSDSESDATSDAGGSDGGADARAGAGEGARTDPPAPVHAAAAGGGGGGGAAARRSIPMQRPPEMGFPLPALPRAAQRASLAEQPCLLAASLAAAPGGGAAWRAPRTLAHEQTVVREVLAMLGGAPPPPLVLSGHDASLTPY